MINVIVAVSTVVAAASEGEEMPSVLAVPIDELIIGIIAFLVVFGGLAKLALPNIKKTLEDRTNAIEGGLERAAAAETEANGMLDQYKAQLAHAREEASAIRTQAQAERSAMIEEARNEAREAAIAVNAAADAQLGRRPVASDRCAHPPDRRARSHAGGQGRG